MDKKKPTHVEVHKGHAINSPKNFELRVIQARDVLKMDPYTSMVVIPYAMNPHKTNIPIILKDTEFNFKNQPPYSSYNDDKSEFLRYVALLNLFSAEFKVSNSSLSFLFSSFKEFTSLSSVI